MPMKIEYAQKENIFSLPGLSSKDTQTFFLLFSFVGVIRTTEHECNKTGKIFHKRHALFTFKCARYIKALYLQYWS